VGRRGGRKRLGPGAEEIVSRPRPVLLDASFLIDLERETAKSELGPARRFLSALRGRPLLLSIVTVEELLEGAGDETAALTSLQRFSIQGLHLAQARRCALLQRRATRRMGENDAWLVATAESANADIVGADRIAFERLGVRYLRHR
jgi:predicted nucleic acid-binding protein